MQEVASLFCEESAVGIGGEVKANKWKVYRNRKERTDQNKAHAKSDECPSSCFDSVGLFARLPKPNM